MNYPVITIPQPALPAVLPTEHQALMNIFYNFWQELAGKAREHNKENEDSQNYLREPHQAEIAAVMPPKVNAAVILGNMHYQIGNGGWNQYDGNGYSSSVDAARNLYEGAANIGIEGASKVVELIDEFKKRKNEADMPGGYWGDEDEDCDGDIYDDLDTQYYDIEGEKLMQEMLDRFEEITAFSFMAGAYRKVA